MAASSRRIAPSIVKETDHATAHVSSSGAGPQTPLASRSPFLDAFRSAGGLTASRNPRATAAATASLRGSPRPRDPTSSAYNNSNSETKYGSNSGSIDEDMRRIDRKSYFVDPSSHNSNNNNNVHGNESNNNGAAYGAAAVSSSSVAAVSPRRKRMSPPSPSYPPSVYTGAGGWWGESAAANGGPIIRLPIGHTAAFDTPTMATSGEGNAEWGSGEKSRTAQPKSYRHHSYSGGEGAHATGPNARSASSQQKGHHLTYMAPPPPSPPPARNDSVSATLPHERDHYNPRPQYRRENDHWEVEAGPEGRGAEENDEEEVHPFDFGNDRDVFDNEHKQYFANSVPASTAAPPTPARRSTFEAGFETGLRGKKRSHSSLATPLSSSSAHHPHNSSRGATADVAATANARGAEQSSRWRGGNSRSNSSSANGLLRPPLGNALDPRPVSALAGADDGCSTPLATEKHRGGSITRKSGAHNSDEGGGESTSVGDATQKVGGRVRSGRSGAAGNRDGEEEDDDFSGYSSPVVAALLGPFVGHPLRPKYTTAANGNAIARGESEGSSRRYQNEGGGGNAESEEEIGAGNRLLPFADGIARNTVGSGAPKSLPARDGGVLALAGADVDSGADLRRPLVAMDGTQFPVGDAAQSAASVFPLTSAHLLLASAPVASPVGVSGGVNHHGAHPRRAGHSHGGGAAPHIRPKGAMDDALAAMNELLLLTERSLDRHYACPARWRQLGGGGGALDRPRDPQVAGSLERRVSRTPPKAKATESDRSALRDVVRTPSPSPPRSFGGGDAADSAQPQLRHSPSPSATTKRGEAAPSEEQRYLRLVESGGRGPQRCVRPDTATSVGDASGEQSRGAYAGEHRDTIVYVPAPSALSRKAMTLLGSGGTPLPSKSGQGPAGQAHTAPVETLGPRVDAIATHAWAAPVVGERVVVPLPRRKGALAVGAAPPSHAPLLPRAEDGVRTAANVATTTTTAVAAAPVSHGAMLTSSASAQTDPPTKSNNGSPPTISATNGPRSVSPAGSSHPTKQAQPPLQLLPRGEAYDRTSNGGGGSALAIIEAVAIAGDGIVIGDDGDEDADCDMLAGLLEMLQAQKAQHDREFAELSDALATLRANRREAAGAEL